MNADTEADQTGRLAELTLTMRKDPRRCPNCRRTGTVHNATACGHVDVADRECMYCQCEWTPPSSRFNGWTMLVMGALLLLVAVGFFTGLIPSHGGEVSDRPPSEEEDSLWLLLPVLFGLYLGYRGLGVLRDKTGKGFVHEPGRPGAARLGKAKDDTGGGPADGGC
jgi:hypothetical protein